MGWIDSVKPAVAIAGPWGLVILMGAALLVAFIKEGLVSGAAVKAADLRRQEEMTRLVAAWEARLAESIAREKAWREVAARSDERADVAAAQVADLLHSLRIIEAHILPSHDAAANVPGERHG